MEGYLASWGLFNHKSQLRSHSCFCFETQQESGEGAGPPHLPAAGVKEARPQSSSAHPREVAPRLRGHLGLALLMDIGSATPSGWASFPLPENAAQLTFLCIEDVRFLLLGLLHSAYP